MESSLLGLNVAPVNNRLLPTVMLAGRFKDSYLTKFIFISL